MRLSPEIAVLDAAMHQAWTRCVGLPGYIKAEWIALEPDLFQAQNYKARDKIAARIRRLQQTQGGEA